jgi:DNA-binding NarL/FixJ family response regulator
LRTLVGANVPVLVVVQRSSDEDEWRALELGAVGYLAVDAAPTALTRGMDAALRGEFVFRRRALGRWFRRGFPEPVKPTCLLDLTRRQQQIASLITTGNTDKEIAARLGISVATVQKHVSKLLRTLGAANRAAAVWVILGRARDLENAERN